MFTSAFDVIALKTIGPGPLRAGVYPLPYRAAPP